MSRRRDLEHHRDSLAEIGEILTSMKTLAYMETRKLARFLSAQQQVVEATREAAADFLAFYPGLPEATSAVTPVLLVIGSERGFCGDFNRALVARLAKTRRDYEPNSPQIVAVGHKLRSLLDADEAVTAILDGASVAEEVPAVLQNLIDELNTLPTNAAGLRLFGIFHDSDDIEVAALLPPFEEPISATAPHPFPPMLNVPADEFLRELVDHYLFSALNHMLYTSLMSENQRRVSHLERAVRHLDQQSTELTRKCRSLRQEEIIEEIEVILLSAEGLDSDAMRDERR